GGGGVGLAASVAAAPACCSLVNGAAAGCGAALAAVSPCAANARPVGTSRRAVAPAPGTGAAAADGSAAGAPSANALSATGAIEAGVGAEVVQSGFAPDWATSNVRADATRLASPASSSSSA